MRLGTLTAATAAAAGAAAAHTIAGAATRERIEAVFEIIVDGD